MYLSHTLHIPWANDDYLAHIPQNNECSYCNYLEGMRHTDTPQHVQELYYREREGALQMLDHMTSHQAHGKMWEHFKREPSHKDIITTHYYSC